MKYRTLAFCSAVFLSIQFVCVPSAHAEVRFTPVDHLVQDTFKVPAGQCYSAPLTLSKGSVLYGNYQAQGAVDSRLDVELMDEFNYRLRQLRQPYQHFTAMSGTVNGGARLKIAVPKSGRYMALFCNGKALLLDRFVSVNLYATRTTLTSEERQLEAAFEEVIRGLHQGFVLPDFDLSIAPCGIENAFSDPNITLCTELLDSIDRNLLAPVMTFVLLHEFAHTALRLWNMPGSDNEDTADEFATAFLLMSKQTSIAEDAANWWLTKAGNIRAEALAKIGVDDRHSLSIQRARNIHRWSQDSGELVDRWLNFWSPHFTDAALKSTAADARYADHSGVKSEMIRRGFASEQQVSQPGVRAGQPVAGSLTTRLKELKDAHDAGLLTDEEYQAQRSKVLSN